MQQMPGRDAYLDGLLRADSASNRKLPELQREVRCDFDLIIGENVSENQSRASRYFCEHLSGGITWPWFMYPCWTKIVLIAGSEFIRIRINFFPSPTGPRCPTECPCRRPCLYRMSRSLILAPRGLQTNVD